MQDRFVTGLCTLFISATLGLSGSALARGAEGPRQEPAAKQEPKGAAASQQDSSRSAPSPQPTVPGPAAESEKPENRKVVGGAPVDPHAYVIGPEDVIFIRVWREPELSGQFSVRPDGKISLPLVNEIAAAGMTPEGLSAKITKDLSACCMVKPEVTVSVQQVNSKKYFIQGEVQRPGAYPLLVPTTVLEALVNAGGFRDFANKKKILVLRSTERLKFNYNDVIKGKNQNQNILLRPGDQIIVP